MICIFIRDNRVAMINKMHVILCNIYPRTLLTLTFLTVH